MILVVAPLLFDSLPDATIPLSWRGGLLCVSIAAKNVRPMWFLLDTGCHRSFLTKRAAARLADEGTKPGSDGTLTLRETRIGGYPVGDLPLGEETPDDDVGSETAVDGYLGVDFLHRYRVGLDLRERTLRLWPTSTPVEDWFTAPPEELIRVPLRERPEGWCVPVEVDNLTVPMVLDTGASSTFLHSDVASLLRGAKKAKNDSGMVRFYDGLHRVRTYTVKAVGLGGISFGERTISVANVPQMVGLLGRDLLSSLKVLLDYPAGTATFAGANAEPFVGLEGPCVTLPDGVAVHWPRGVVANAPPGCAYTLPAGYREVFKGDESVDLVPPRGTGAI